MKQHLKSQKSNYIAKKNVFCFNPGGSKANQAISYNIENTSKTNLRLLKYTKNGLVDVTCQRLVKA